LGAIFFPWVQGAKKEVTTIIPFSIYADTECIKTLDHKTALHLLLKVEVVIRLASSQAIGAEPLYLNCIRMQK
jgi:hypothetical protein